MRITDVLFALTMTGLAACNSQTTRVARDGQPVTQSEGTVAEKARPALGQVGSRLPQFSLKTLDGLQVSSADLIGKVALVDYWATWCAPCKKEMPGYQKLADRYGGRGFVVVGLKFDAMADTIDPLKFAKAAGIHYPLAVPPEELNEKFGGIEGIPTTMIYDRAGILRKKIIGFEYTQVVEAAVKALL